MGRTPSAQEVSLRLAEMVGQRAWGAALGVGSFLTVEFGEEQPPRAHHRGRPAAPQRRHGSWHVWLYCCAWRIDGPTGVVVGSEDPRERIRRAVPELDGRTLVDATPDHPGCGLRLVFDGGLVLTAFPVHSAGYEHWHLHFPDGAVLTAGPGSSYDLEHAPGR